MQIVPQMIPQNYLGWGAEFPLAKTLAGFFYNASAFVLYTATLTAQFNVWLNISGSFAGGFLYSSSPDSYYAGRLCTGNSPCLLEENCKPLTTESGVFLVI